MGGLRRVRVGLVGRAGRVRTRRLELVWRSVRLGGAALAAEDGTRVERCAGRARRSRQTSDVRVDHGRRRIWLLNVGLGRRGTGRLLTHDAGGDGAGRRAVGECGGKRWEVIVFMKRAPVPSTCSAPTPERMLAMHDDRKRRRFA